MKKQLICLIFCATIFGACNKSSSTYTPDCSGPEKSFSNDVFPIIENSCVGCHPNFTGYASINASKNKIRSAIADGIMPQQGSLTDTQKNAVLCWIDNGAPNN
jgi:hypothetical protein